MTTGDVNNYFRMSERPSDADERLSYRVEQGDGMTLAERRRAAELIRAYLRATPPTSDSEVSMTMDRYHEFLGYEAECKLRKPAAEKYARICERMAEQNVGYPGAIGTKAEWELEANAMRQCAAAIRDDASALNDSGEPGRIPDLEGARVNADYWKHGAWNEPSREDALQCMEQAVNAWKNAAYAMADQRDALRSETAQPSASEAAALSKLKAALGCGEHWDATITMLNASVRIRRLEEEAALRADGGGAKVPDGWKLVPVEPTNEMLIAIANSFWPDDWQEDESMRSRIKSECADAIKDMLAAAPSPSGVEEGDKP